MVSDDSSAAPLLLTYDDDLSPQRDSDILDVSDSDQEFNYYFLCSQYQPWRLSLSKVIEEIKQLYTIALPMIITGLLIYGKSAISMFFMGKLGKDELAGGSLSIGIANITGYSLISGLSMGMEAISSQACGAKQWPLIGQTLQRTIVILILACLPISLLWLNFQPILLLCGQDPLISSIASIYLTFSIPDLFFLSVINPLKIYLRTQNVTVPLMLSAGFALSLHAPINYIIIYHLKLGIQGIALAVAITDFNMLLTLLLYLSFSGTCSESWHGWSVQCFHDWKPILRLAIPSCVSVCLEWWWYELVIILSGFLPNAADAIATMGIIIQATSFVYIFPSSLSLAVSTRVGNELGADQPNKAKTSSVIAVLSAVLMSVVAMFFMTTMRNAWGQIFTKDAAILSLTAVSLPVVGLCELGNWPQTTGCGVLRGSARPSLGANINLGSFYGVGLPMAVFMGFVMKMGLVGLWLGLLSAQIVCSFIMMAVLINTDWIEQADRGKELIGIDVNVEPEGKV